MRELRIGDGCYFGWKDRRHWEIAIGRLGVYRWCPGAPCDLPGVTRQRHAVGVAWPWRGYRRGGGSMDYDDTVFEAVRIAEARKRHGVKRPACRRFECTSPAAPDPINKHLVEVCEAHQRETDAELDRMEAQRDQRLGA